MSGWTAEAELRGMTHTESLASAIEKLAVGGDDPSNCSLTLVRDWYRAGAESYIYVFDIVCTNDKTRLLFKAFVGFPAGGSLVAKHNEMLYRRELLADNGVAVPRLYGVAGATILEEYIVDDLDTGIAGADSKARRNLAEDLIHYGAVLDRLGFFPVSPFSDLRTDGSRLFVVDFGADLGPPGKFIDGTPFKDQATTLLLQHYKMPLHTVQQARIAAETRLLSSER
jgi:hypothetical protein